MIGTNLPLKLLFNNLHDVILRGFVQFHMAANVTVVTEVDVQVLVRVLGGQAGRVMIMNRLQINRVQYLLLILIHGSRRIYQSNINDYLVFITLVHIVIKGQRLFTAIPLFIPEITYPVVIEVGTPVKQMIK